MAPVKLRAHHLLCLFGWRGEGYSEEFTENFNSIVSKLRDSDQFELVEGVDDVCAACPKRAPGGCDADGLFAADPAVIDGRVLDYIGLDIGGVYSFGRVLEIVRDRIAPLALAVICRGCAWESEGRCAAGLESGRTAGCAPSTTSSF